jgi:hypothetical protein
MLAEHPLLITPTADAAVQTAARELASSLLERAPAERKPASTLLVAGLHADIDAWLASVGMATRPAMLSATHGSAQVWTAHTGDGRIVVLVSVQDAPSLAALSRPLPHYGQQSYLVFEGARAVERGTWPAQPQVWVLK